MDSLVINGPGRLEGTVAISGAKNAALKVLCASLLTPEGVRLSNIPTGIEDVKVQLGMLESIGVRVVASGAEVCIDGSSISGYEVIMDQEKGIRTSLLMLGALLARFGEGRVPLPGGCTIGERKYDLHIMVLEKLGATVKVSDDGFLEAECDRLRGAEITFPLRTTGATEHAIIASCLAEGRTVLKNAHTRPEVFDLVRFLNTMGADIRIVGSGWIEIEGVKELHGTSYGIIPDSVEALTFIIAAAVTRGDIEIAECPLDALEIPLIYLRESGVRFDVAERSLRVTAPARLTALDISTGPYPGINSDFQPLFTAYATQAEGVSTITDIRFRDRFDYVTELLKMGARISREGNTIIIAGGTPLKSARVHACDLRAGAAVLIAGLCARGTTEIDNVYQIDRGYEEIDVKLKGLGVAIERRHPAGTSAAYADSMT
ncbi:MAG: UDP-N-acetylglucosamine 1-carboxyvinyltransferase [Candidatus Omnitrophica bacterium]|nr:UDP-N-acetylglucosamine 1-carboxyvinyltransferase [Candidatus Omnitrophota bacterium]